MPTRNSINSEQPPATNLRRSPRFLHIAVTASEDPKPPKSKSVRARINPPGAPSFSSTPKVSAREGIGRKVSLRPDIGVRRSPRFLHIAVTNSDDPKSPKTKSIRARISPPSAPSFSSTPKVSAREGIVRKESLRPDIGVRRSARLIGRVEDFSHVDLSHLGNVERRVTRSSVRGNTNSDIQKSCIGKLEKRATCSFRRGITLQDVKKIGYDKNTEVLDEKEPSTLQKGNAGKYNQKSAHGKYDGFDENVSGEFLDRGVPSPVAVIEGRSKRVGENNDEEQVIGVKRKRNPTERSHSIVHGWSKDQELALDRAYFATKPTPHFWKKVAKLVPGKSAQDCFNKVHSDHMTPPEAQPRSRAKIKSSPHNSFSASKLFNSSSPMVKRPRKKSLHLVQKTVRHLLQKQCQVDQNSEEDLFSVLEPRMSPSTQSIQQDQIITTPDNKQEKLNLLRRCRERSSSANKKKSLSRFSGSSGTNLVSPLVLKPLKNKALHEKYVDFLHCREANRKLASVRAAKLKGVNGESLVQKTDAIKAAKNALVFDARDAIKQFQNSQANALMNSFSDDEDGADNDDSDEGEDD